MSNICAIIPALNEEDTIEAAVGGLLNHKSEHIEVSKVIVVDNGSSDKTAARAEAAGAQVVSETDRGYGAACLRGIKEADGYEVIVFMDADGSDQPGEYILLVDKIISEDYDLVIGSRTLKNDSSKTLPFHQKFGNRLISFLLGFKYSKRVTDLGPFRAIKAKSLKALQMKDKDFGWTVEMQIKAFRNNLNVTEVPVTYGPRQGGVSKISGTINGSFLAGQVILSYIAKDYLGILK